VPGIYAAGDVKGGPAFTHIAYDDFRILKANNFGALNIKKRGINKKSTFTLQHIKGEVNIYFGEKQKYTFTINVAPLEVWSEP